MRYVVLPAAVAFRQSRPDFDIRLFEEDHENVFALVEDGHVDLGIGVSQPGFDDLRRETLYTAQVYSLVPPTHRLANKTHLTVEELAGERLLFHKTSSSGEALRQMLFRLRLFEPSVVLVSHIPETLLLAAQANFGIAIVTDTFEFEDYNLDAIPIVDNGRQLEVTNVVASHIRHHLSEAEDEFIGLLKKFASERKREGYVPWPGQDVMPEQGMTHE